MIIIAPSLALSQAWRKYHGLIGEVDSGWHDQIAQIVAFSGGMERWFRHKS
jgi:hypothetical protein